MQAFFYMHPSNLYIYIYIYIIYICVEDRNLELPFSLHVVQSI